MKIRGLIIAILAFGGLTGLLYWSEHRKPEETAKASGDIAPTILKLDRGNITKLEIRKKDAPPVLLDKANANDWRILQPKQMNADQEAVSGVLSTLSPLNSDRLVEEKSADLKRFGFDPASLEIDVTEKNNKTQKLLLGDDTPTGGDLYAMLAGDPRIFAVASNTKTSLDKSVNDLRDKRLVTMPSDKISRLELDRKNQDIEFGRDKDEWQILTPKPLRADSIAVGDLVQKLTDARVDLSGTEDAASAFAHGVPVAIARVTGQSGTQELQLRKNKHTYYAKSSVLDGAYKVGDDLGKALDKGLDDFRNKKIFDLGYTDPSKIELHFGSKAYYLTHNADDWWSDGKKMDAGSVQPLVSKIQEMAATRFPESGFANPTVEIAVTSSDGKTVEKAAIVKSGTNYIAKRENEPALYQIDSSVVDALQKDADGVKPATPTHK